MNLNKLLETISKTAKIPVIELTGKSQKAEVAIPRHIFCYIASEKGIAKDKIGAVINRNRATVHGSCKVVINCLQTRDKLYSELVNKIMNNINY